MVSQALSRLVRYTADTCVRHVSGRHRRHHALSGCGRRTSSVRMQSAIGSLLCVAWKSTMSPAMRAGADGLSAILKMEALPVIRFDGARGVAVWEGGSGLPEGGRLAPACVACSPADAWQQLRESTILSSGGQAPRITNLSEQLCRSSCCSDSGTFCQEWKVSDTIAQPVS